MRVFVWLIRAALFFTLFAFALNNQHEVSVHWFFSHEWRSPMVFIVLASFTLGCLVGGLAMAPSWWRHRRQAKRGLMAEADNLATRPQPEFNTSTEQDSSVGGQHAV